MIIKHHLNNLNKATNGLIFNIEPNQTIKKNTIEKICQNFDTSIMIKPFINGYLFNLTARTLAGY